MNIKELRQNRKISQTKFAQEIGVKQNTLSQYENNKRIPSPQIILKMAKSLNVSCELILKCFIDSSKVCENEN